MPRSTIGIVIAVIVVIVLIYLIFRLIYEVLAGPVSYGISALCYYLLRAGRSPVSCVVSPGPSLCQR
jgi:hypothetical protein